MIEIVTLTVCILSRYKHGPIFLIARTLLAVRTVFVFVCAVTACIASSLYYTSFLVPLSTGLQEICRWLITLQVGKVFWCQVPVTLYGMAQFGCRALAFGVRVRLGVRVHQVVCFKYRVHRRAQRWDTKMAGTMAGTMMEDGGVAFLFELARCRDTVPSR